MGCLLLLAAPVRPQEDRAVDQLRRELEYVFSDPSFATSHWGVAIQSAKTGEYLYLRNENKAFMPASNMKLFTTAAALLALGPDYRLVTRLYANGPVDANGVLQGDLVIVGCGDPSLSGRWENGKVTAVFERWADSLRHRGIKKITGRVVGDGRYFNDEAMGSGWPWDDMTDWYSAQISALTFNDNCVDITVNPGDSLGAASRLRLDPNTAYVQVINRSATARHTDLNYRRDLGRNRVICRGTISRTDHDVKESVTVENPARYAAFVFTEILMDRGIRVGAAAIDVNDTTDYPVIDYPVLPIATHSSPPLSEIVRMTNKESQNLFAELLLRIVGHEAGDGGSADSGEKAAKRIFERMGISPEQLNMSDGSGLSREDLVTPLSVIKLLRYMRQDNKAGDAFYASLPIAGIDGTIEGRMKFTAAKNNVHAKTGYIGRVRSLSGYVTTRDNEELIFSMICNNYSSPTGNANYLQDLVCERLANFSRQ